MGGECLVSAGQLLGFSKGGSKTIETHSLIGKHERTLYLRGSSIDFQLPRQKTSKFSQNWRNWRNVLKKTYGKLYAFHRLLELWKKAKDFIHRNSSCSWASYSPHNNQNFFAMSLQLDQLLKCSQILAVKWSHHRSFG